MAILLCTYVGSNAGRGALEWVLKSRHTRVVGGAGRGLAASSCVLRSVVLVVACFVQACCVQACCVQTCAVSCLLEPSTVCVDDAAAELAGDWMCCLMVGRVMLGMLYSLIAIRCGRWLQVGDVLKVLKVARWNEAHVRGPCHRCLMLFFVC